MAYCSCWSCMHLTYGYLKPMFWQDVFVWVTFPTLDCNRIISYLDGKSGLTQSPASPQSAKCWAGQPACAEGAAEGVSKSNFWVRPHLSAPQGILLHASEPAAQCVCMMMYLSEL